MRKIVCCGVLLLAASSVSAFTAVGNGYRADYPFAPIQIVGDAVVLPGISRWNNTDIESSASFAEDTGLTFEALSGFRIDSYDITYSLSFTSGTYLVTGNEGGADFGGVTPGNLFVGSGRFEATTGPPILFLATDPDSSVEVTHHVRGATLDLRYSMFVRGLADFCADAVGCTGNGPFTSMRSTLELRSIAIAPHVTAVPEPAAYALTLAGLLVVATASRRHRKPSGTSA